jgi:hypothetical protein
MLLILAAFFCAAFYAFMRDLGPLMIRNPAASPRLVSDGEIALIMVCEQNTSFRDVKQQVPAAREWDRIAREKLGSGYDIYYRRSRYCLSG